MNTLYKLKEPSARLLAGFLLSMQAVIGVPFLLTIVGSVRHWGTWFHPKDPR
jgi:hypothetical protein